MIRRFPHDVVAITGAATGIGAETARQFTCEGARVAVIDRSVDRLQVVAGALPAEAILFLASPDAAFITGVCLPVDGGVSASNGQPSMQ